MPVRTITLRIGTVVAAALLAGLPLAGIASAAPAADKDCGDYPSQAAAQAALDSDRTDPNGLDRDKDGKACEDHDYGSTGGGVPASTAPGSSTPGAGGGAAASAAPGSSTPGAGGGAAASAAPGSSTPGATSPSVPSGSVSDEPDQVVAVPSGSIDAGDGSGAESGAGGVVAATFVLVGFGAVVGAGGCAAVWRTRRAGSAGAVVPSGPGARAAGPGTTVPATRRTRSDAVVLRADRPGVAAPVPAPRTAADDVTSAAVRRR